MIEKIQEALLIILLLVVKAFSTQATSNWHIVAHPFPFFYRLYSNEVFDIHQDSEGYIWLGTTSALVRYDGYNLRTFRRDYSRPKLLTNNGITYMDDTKRYLWVGTAKGVTIYDKFTYHTHKLKDHHIDNRPIDDVAVDHSTDEVWIGSGNHIFRYSADGSRVAGYQLYAGGSDDGFHQFYIDHTHRLWVMSQKGLFLFDRHRNHFSRYPDMPNNTTPYTMLQDKQGHCWIGTWGGGLYLFNPHASSSACYIRQPLKVTGTNNDDPIIYSMAQDDAFGYLWLLSYNELHAMRYAGGKLVPVDISHIIEPYKMFTKIIKDREGNLWLGSYDMGYIISFYNSGIVNYPLQDISRLLHHDPNITSLAAFSGSLWIGQDRYGLLRYDMQTGQTEPLGRLGIGEVSLLKRSRNGNLWACTRFGSRLLEVTTSKGTPHIAQKINLSNLLNNPGTIKDFYEDHRGNLWILATPNLYVRRQNATTISTATGVVQSPDAITIEPNGNVWAAVGHNLYRLAFDGSNIQTAGPITIPMLAADESVVSLCADANGALWMATSLGRLVRSDQSKHKFITVGGGSDSYGVFLTLQPSGDKMWVMTNKRLRSIDINTGQQNIYSANAGNINVMAFRGRAICTDEKGSIFAAGHGGVVQVAHSSSSIPLHKGYHFTLTDVIVGDSSAIFDNPDDDTRKNFIVLDSHSRNIAVRFSPLVYAPTASSTVQYLLEGVDDSWNTVKAEDFTAFYSSLPRGKHRFLVRYQQADGSYSQPFDLATIVRKPAWYETKAAFTAYIVLACLGMFLIVRAIISHTNQSALRYYHSQKRVDALVEGAADNTGKATEEPFVAELMALIDKHIDDTDYGLDQLSQDLLMSRSTLYRKVKGISGMSPQDFMRNVKMHRAQEMLKLHELSISQIAYALGFSNPKYFTKCFKEETGMTPTEFQKQG